MITSETMAVIEEHFCEVRLEKNGCTGGWTMKACQILKRQDGTDGEQIAFFDRTFNGKSIADCFAKASEFVNAGVR